MLALLQMPCFRKLLEYEYQRAKPRSGTLMSDVYDGQAWQEFVGEPRRPVQRIVLQGCMDGFSAFQCGSLSLKPFILLNFSIAPRLRTKAEFMLLYLLVPTSLKGFAQKKFFDYVAKRELNELYETGAGCCITYYCGLIFKCIFII